MNVSMKLVAPLLAMLALFAACAPALGTHVHTLEIENRCTGPESRVQVYLNNRYVGDVYNASVHPTVREANLYRNRMLIPGVPRGTHRWRIVGTGPGGSVLETERPVLEDSRWILCGG